MDIQEAINILVNLNEEITEHLLLIDKSSRLLDQKGKAYYKQMEKGAKQYEAIKLAIKALEHTERCKNCKGVCESMVME